MPRYRKKPVVVEAIQFLDVTNDYETAREFCPSLSRESRAGVWRYFIDTLEGQMQVAAGDYIIRGVQGEYYPCKGDIFMATYSEEPTPEILPQNESAVSQAIKVLNEALEADREAVSRLMAMEVEVAPEPFIDHPTIQVGHRNYDPEQPVILRPLGLINGLFGADQDTWGFIAMNVNEDGSIAGFVRIPERGG